jgi:hypothetical protein
MDEPHQRKQVETGWAPRDLTDGREPFDWESRYPVNARRWMRAEAIYLLSLLFLVPISVGISATGRPASWLNLALSENNYTTFLAFFWAWLGGMLGGTLFSLKWLYHSRAKGLWNMDRIFWRLFTPHLSAGLSFAFVALVSSGLLNLFNNEILNKPLLSFSLSFLTGYFSDTAIAKLTEVAETVFGPTRAAPSGSSSGGAMRRDIIPQNTVSNPGQRIVNQ